MSCARSFLVLLALIVFAHPALQSRQMMFKQPLSPRLANYSIQVTLDDTAKMLTAQERLTWRNASADVITELQFHLYLNAFKNSASTFMKESGGVHRGSSIGDDGWGWIDVTSMRTAAGEDLMSGAEFIHPDDDNAQDQTVLRVVLPQPVRPGAILQLEISFRAKLPTIFARTGYHKDFFMVGQWFPKIGVYEPAGMRYATKGGWNCHQFHSNTEFYSDFGVYDVDITLPTKYVVGATGVLVSDTENGNGTKTLRFHAEDVHDFSWTASPHYVVADDQWRDVAIRILMQPQRTHQISRYAESVKKALAYLDEHVGAYPYPIITIVDPAYGGMGAGGMEYPMLITAGSFWGIGQELKFAELVTIHEFGHEYWYGMVASNEFEEAWLDEGINSYYETRIMDEAYGSTRSVIDFDGFHAGDHDFSRGSYVTMRNPKVSPIATPAWKFKAGGYGTLTYQKTATVMTTLENLIGRAAMDSAMKTYFDRWKFKHPSEKDFRAVFDEIVPVFHGDRFGKSMSWYFDQLIDGTDVCDYELTSISTEPVRATVGVIGQRGEKAATAREAWSDSSRQYRSRVLVSRLGEVQLPVVVEIGFESGEKIVERWDGQERWKEFIYERTDRVRWAAVDPDRQLMVDMNLLNNSKTVDPEGFPIRKHFVKMLFWIQNALQLVALGG